MGADEAKKFRHVMRYCLAWTHAVAGRKQYYLDMGSGTGYGTELLASDFKYAFGIEHDVDALEYAKEKHSRSGVLYFPSIEATGIKSGKFDFITCIEMIEHLEKVDGAKLLHDLSKLLDEDGTLVLTTPAAVTLTPQTPHHKHEYTPEELTELLRTFFNVVEVQDISMGIPNMIAICRGPR